MNSVKIADEIINIYKKHGFIEYGEQCNMLSHSVQTGLVAKAKGYDNELVLAGFLHDIGHLTPLEFNKDKLKTMGIYGVEQHDKWGEAYLRKKGFSERIIAPVANHVKSKRYLCFIDTNYFNKLTYASKKTLEYQGGLITEEEAKSFEKTIYFKESLLIRQAEEESKKQSFNVSYSHLNYYSTLIKEALQGCV
ncbi:MAG: HD domain-containing protein [Tenacibaculum sp.]